MEGALVFIRLRFDADPTLRPEIVRAGARSGLLSEGIIKKLLSAKERPKPSTALKHCVLLMSMIFAEDKERAMGGKSERGSTRKRLRRHTTGGEPAPIAASSGSEDDEDREPLLLLPRLPIPRDGEEESSSSTPSPQTLLAFMDKVRDHIARTGTLPPV